MGSDDAGERDAPLIIMRGVGKPLGSAANSRGDEDRKRVEA